MQWHTRRVGWNWAQQHEARRTVSLSHSLSLATQQSAGSAVLHTLLAEEEVSTLTSAMCETRTDGVQNANAKADTETRNSKNAK